MTPTPEILRYRDSDAAEVAHLLGIVPELPDTTEASLRSFTRLGFNRGARDFCVAREGGVVVAFLASTLLTDVQPPLRHFRIAVHPAHRRRGLGTRLLALVREQAGPPGTLLQCNTQSSWTAANAFLSRFAFSIASVELLMRRPLPAPMVPMPTGALVRQATRADDEAWMRLHAHGYSDRSDFSALTPSDLEAERRSPGFALAVAEEDGQVVGFAHGLELAPGRGLLNSVVVHRDHRGQRLARALVLAILRDLAAHGAETVELNVDADNAPAIRVYRQLGFAVFDEMQTWRRSVENAP